MRFPNFGWSANYKTGAEELKLIWPSFTDPAIFGKPFVHITRKRDECLSKLKYYIPVAGCEPTIHWITSPEWATTDFAPPKTKV